MVNDQLKHDLFAGDEQEELRVKEIFFAQYYGQKICRYFDLISQKRMCKINEFTSHRTSESCLELRTVSHLAGVELLNIAKLIDGHITDTYSERQLLEVAYRFIHHFNTNKNFIYSINEVSGVLGYLKSISIILPFTFITKSGEVKTLTVDNLLTLGWAKIKEG